MFNSNNFFVSIVLFISSYSSIFLCCLYHGSNACNISGWIRPLWIITKINYKTTWLIYCYGPVWHLLLNNSNNHKNDNHYHHHHQISLCDFLIYRNNHTSALCQEAWSCTSSTNSFSSLVSTWPMNLCHIIWKLRHAQEHLLFIRFTCSWLLVPGCLVSNGHVSLLHNNHFKLMAFSGQTACVQPKRKRKASGKAT